MTKEPLTRVLFIGVDSGDKDLVSQWTTEGELPTIARIAERSLTGEVTNPCAIETGSVWPSFNTGNWPGKHPLYDGLRRFDRTDYIYTWFTPDDAVPRPFWKRLSDAGLKCAVIDAPYTFLDPEINGLNVVDYGSHVPSRGGSVMNFATQPPEARQEILDLVGPDPTGGALCDDICPETTQDLIEFRDMYLERMRRKARFTEHFLKKGEWDYFHVVFTDPHCMGHHLWHVNDPHHPRYSAKQEAVLGEPLKDIYKELDRSIDRLVRHVDERTYVFFYCSHGIGPQFTATGLLDQLLVCFDSGEAFKQPRGLKFTAKGIWDGLPVAVRKGLRPIKNRFEGVVRTNEMAGNRQNRKYFEVFVSNSTGGVRLNLKGREAQGIVDRGDYDRILSDLEKKLHNVIIQSTGEKLVKSMHRSRETHPGERSDDLPDLLIQWNKNSPIDAVQSDDVGLVPNRFGLDRRTGDHKPDGMFWMSGPNVKPLRMNRKTNVVDFAATMHDCLNVDRGGLPGEPLPIKKRDLVEA